MVVNVGEALIDFIPVYDTEGNAAYRGVEGGSPYNAAVALARLGVKNAFFSKISRDFFGDQLMDCLKSNNVDTGLVRRTEEPTTLAFVKRNAQGEARYAFFSHGAADSSLTREEIPKLPDSVQVIQCGSISLIVDPTGDAIVHMVETQGRNRVVSCDPNIRPSLVHDKEKYIARLQKLFALSTIIKLSDEDISWIQQREGRKKADVDEMAYNLLELGAALVVVTQGAKGARVFTHRAAAETTAEIAGQKIIVADTIGAGDSFHAALLAFLYHADMLSKKRIESLTEETLQYMLNFSAAAAAVTCSRLGADPPLLTEIDMRFHRWK